jgi:hypothetical protein
VGPGRLFGRQAANVIRGVSLDVKTCVFPTVMAWAEQT